MKLALSIGLLAAFALTSCEIDEPPRRNVRRPVAKYPTPQQTQYPAQPQPFAEDGVTTTTTTTGSAPALHESTTTEAVSAPSNNPPSQPATQTTAKGDYPYAIPVPGKPGFVRSPFSPDKMTDVRGYAPGTEVKDPYTGKIFLVP